MTLCEKKLSRRTFFALMGGFVSANDLAGKTVVPFCTSASSGAGTSGEDLVGEPATRFSSSAAEDEVHSWASGLFV